MANKLRFTFYTTPGLADLRAQFYTTTGANSGAVIDTGFLEVGTNGMYNFFGDPGDGFTGGVKFYSLADPTNILAIRDISPPEFENNNVKASTLATASSLATVANGVASILDDTGTSGVVISTAVMQALADVIMSRSFEVVEDTASMNSLAELLMAILNSRTEGEDWIIKKSDGSTFNTRVLELDEEALPVKGVSNA